MAIDRDADSIHHRVHGGNQAAGESQSKLLESCNNELAVSMKLAENSETESVGTEVGNAEPLDTCCCRCKSPHAGYGYSVAPAGRPLMTFQFSMRTTELLVAATTIGSVYISLIVSYFTHTEEIAKLHEHCDSPGANGTKLEQHILPSASYGIGIFQPQCFLFLAAIVPHAFARVFELNFFYTYYKQFVDSPHYNKCFYRYHSLPILYIWDVMELYGLVSLTLVNIEENFALHAFGYFCWVFGFCAVVFNHPFLYYGAGLSVTSKKRALMYRVRAACFPLATALCLGSGVLYYFYYYHCSPAVYNAFTGVEYCVATMNSAYHALNYVDFPDIVMAGFAYAESMAMRRALERTSLH